MVSQLQRKDSCILGDPGATGRDDAIVSGESLLQELKSPWELILTEPVPKVVEFRPADWVEKYFYAQSARRSSLVTLSPSYTRQFSSSIDPVAWPVQRDGCSGEFQKKVFNQDEKMASFNMGARNQYSSINVLGGFIEGISYFFIANVRDFYTVVFGFGESQSSTQGYLGQVQAKFRRGTSHEPNRMQMSKILCSPSFAFDSAHVKYGV